MQGARTHGQFDQDDADVGNHRQQHFTHGFGLLGALFRRGEAVHAGELGQFLYFVHAFDQLANGTVAAFGNQFVPSGNVFADVGQNRSGHGIRQEVEFADDLHRAEKMFQQWLAVSR